jgi:signal transduction histidine kinase
MASWIVSAAHVLAFAAWGVSGLVAVLLAPRNRAARRLGLAGALLVATRLLDHLLVQDPMRSTAASTAWQEAWFLGLVAEVAFLGALAAVVATLAVFPDGRYDRRWHRAVVLALVAATGIVAALRLLARTSYGSSGQSSATAWLHRVADVVYATEPAWIVTGVVILLLRYRRSDAERRAQLRWTLLALGVLAVLLVAVLIVVVTGVDFLGDGPVPEVAFMLALSLFPMALLASVVARVHDLESRVMASRARLVEAEDAARRRVERDLHDGVQQHMTAIQSLVQLAARQVDRDPALAAVTIQEIAGETQDAARNLREVVAGIHPAVLTDHGLVRAVEARLHPSRSPTTWRLRTSHAATRRPRSQDP